VLYLAELCLECMSQHLCNSPNNAKVCCNGPVRESLRSTKAQACKSLYWS
jgi:hypothetical protein